MSNSNGKMVAYLSGAIEYSPDGGAAWRNDITEFVTKVLGHEVYHPNEVIHDILSDEEIACFRDWKENDPLKFKDIIRRIIDHDLDVLENEADYIICYWDEYAKLGAGTHGEVTMAYKLQKPVFLVTDMPKNSISAWILGCSEKIFFDFETLKSHMESEFGSRG